MRMIVAAGVIALAAGLFAVLPAAAAPDNKNTTTFDVSCDAPIGDVTVTEIARGQGDGAVFTEDGQVLVAKRISGISNVTLSIEGGPTIPLEEDVPFEEGSKGKGFEDRLVSCDFTIEFEDTFTLKRNHVRFFGLDPEFIGATATVTGTITGTAEVIAPGS